MLYKATYFIVYQDHRVPFSKRRADYLASGTPTADVLPSGGEFLVKLSVGTPPFEVSGILDTTSALSWTQCVPCTNCFPQKQPLFTPNKSSSYKVVAGNSKSCKSLGGTPSTSGDNSCRYSLSYQVKHHSRGVLSSDTITMKTTSGAPASLPNMVFGCGYDNSADTGVDASGVIGLGVGPSSLITQMNSVTGGKFSYCLVPNAHSNPKPSKMHFGSRAAVTGASVVTTAMQIVKNSYAVTLKGISVGTTRLLASALSDPPYSSKIFGFSDQKMIVDTGTIATRIPVKLYESLEAAMRKQINMDAHPDPDSLQRLCYKTPGRSMLAPIVTLHFAGANVKLYPVNTFLNASNSKDVHCLAFQPDKRVAILGNLAQVNFLVGFDLGRKLVSFKQTDCTNQ